MCEFNQKVVQIINDIEKHESINIGKCALELYKSFRKNGLVHLFATGHSHMFMEEMFYRAGGLVPVNPVFVSSLMQHEGAIRSTSIERMSGLAKSIYDSLDLLEFEPFIIVSNSGINNVICEMAELVKTNGHPLIAITSMESYRLSSSRSKAGKLADFASIVIDNHSPIGDCVIDGETKYGAVSTIANSYIAQKIVLEVIELYKKDNLVPPVYQSANTPGGDEHNKKLYQIYSKRIRSLY